MAHNPFALSTASRQLRRGLALALAAGGLLAASAITGPSAEAAVAPSGQDMPTALPGWKVTFADDFNGTAVDTTKWGRYDGIPRGGEGAVWDRDHALVQDGRLVLKGEQVGDQWVSAGVSNARAGSQLYGRYDIRFRMDKGNGMGFAVLMYPGNGTWPPELDLAEDGGGARTRSMTTLHWGADNQQNHQYAYADFSQWHTMSVVWKRGSMTYFLDGAQFGGVQSSNVPEIPMWFGMQTQWKGCSTVYNNCPYSTNPTNINMDVDWVVRWAPDEGSVTPTTTTTLLSSASADRSSPRPLNGSAVSGSAYVWADAPADASQVRFYLDDPETVGTPLSVEDTAPFDLVGATSTGTAQPWSTAKLAAGPHTLTAVTVTSTGVQQKTTASFTKTGGTAVTVSTSADRSGAVPLAGATVSGTRYITATPASTVSEVRFYLDDPWRAKAPLAVERYAPYDILGGTYSAAAPWSSSTLAAGRHTLTVAAVSSSGAITLTDVPFTK